MRERTVVSLDRHSPLRSDINAKDVRRITLSQRGARSWSQQDELENAMIQYDWGKWKVPLCLSYHGLFAHDEVDG